MVYVALLRGINVGGKNIVDMKRLKAVFEDAGMTSVRTYINSGNVIFSTKRRGGPRLVTTLEQAIAEHFGFDVKVVVRDVDAMRALVAAIPSDWTDDQTMRCYVMFLMPDVDRPSIVDELKFKPEIEDVRYASGAVIWRTDRENVTRSGMMRLASTPFYKQVTVRNCNTTRKLLQLMQATA